MKVALSRVVVVATINRVIFTAAKQEQLFCNTTTLARVVVAPLVNHRFVRAKVKNAWEVETLVAAKLFNTMEIRMLKVYDSSKKGDN